MSYSDIENLSMSDLVELFKKQVNLYGIPFLDKCILFLEFDGVDDSVTGDEKSVLKNDGFDSSSCSEDDLSNSSRDDESFDDTESSSGNSDDEEMFSEDEISEDGSINDSVAEANSDERVLHLHDPIVFNTRHCPPFEFIENTLHRGCDCCEFGMEFCGQVDEFQFFPTLDFVQEYTQAFETVDAPDRIPSNLLHKRLYKLLFYATDFGILEKGVNCQIVQ